MVLCISQNGFPVETVDLIMEISMQESEHIFIMFEDSEILFSALFPMVLGDSLDDYIFISITRQDSFKNLYFELIFPLRHRVSIGGASDFELPVLHSNLPFNAYLFSE